MSGPLEGVRVFDLTLLMVGPWSTQNLGAMGAEVIHVERPGIEESSLGGGIPPNINGTSVVYITCNMNKREIFLDLKSPDDLDVAKKLISTCDVFVENMRPGVVDRLGLSYEVLSALNPRLIYVAVSGWGETGPMADKPGTDNRVQAFAGFASLNGAPGAQPESYRHYTQIDGTSGNYITQGILLALMARERTGRGQRVDISMLEAALALQTSRIGEYLATGKQAPLLGSASAAIAPSEAFLCEDGHFLGVEARTEGEWKSLCQALRLENLAQDNRFATNAARVSNRQALSELLAATLRTKPSRWWQLKLGSARVPNGRFMRFEELIHHPQVTENNYIERIDTEAWGKIYVGGVPWAFSRTPVKQRHTSLVGEDTAELLDEVESMTPGEPASRNGSNGHLDSRPPLTGYRVIELAQGLSGPYAAAELADAGAEVIKVEPLTGDAARQWEPQGASGDSGAFIQLNRGKKSVKLDLESEQGRDILRKLVARCDVLIEDADLTHELGLDLDALSAGNERVVHARITGFGPKGELAGLPSSEIGAQLMAEVTTSLGYASEPPVRVGADLASTYAAIHCVQGILAALWRRERDGKGQKVDVSLFGSLAVMRTVMWAALSNPDDWSGFHLDSYAKPPEQGFRTKDGAVSLGVGRISNENWESLLADLGFDPATDREKMDAIKAAGNPGTTRTGHTVRPLWELVLPNFTTDEVIEILERNKAEGYPINSIEQVLSSAQVQHLGVVKEVKQDGETLSLIRSPWRFSETPISVERGPPALGAHNDEVLRELAELEGAAAS